MNTKKVVIITGASRGIGKAIAELFAMKGHYDLVLISRHFQEVEKTAREILEKYSIKNN